MMLNITNTMLNVVRKQTQSQTFYIAAAHFSTNGAHNKVLHSRPQAANSLIQSHRRGYSLVSGFYNANTIDSPSRPKTCDKNKLRFGGTSETAAASWNTVRGTHTTGLSVPPGGKGKNQPLKANEAPFPAGIASFMRLPLQNDTKGLDACVVGVPLDTGVTNRSGTRFGPRQIRNESIGLRPHNSATGVSPFQHLNVADIGDAGFTMYNLPEALVQIRTEFDNIVSGTCIPITMGGEHTITYPILQAIASRHGPVAVIHVDAHADVDDTVWGSPRMHATPFRRAVEEGLVTPEFFYQIGLRGSGYDPSAYEWSKQAGMTVVPATECWHKSLTPLMEEVRAHIGNKPVYLSFDIDAIDPCFCPGTGTREVAGLTTIQAVELVRGCAGLNLVGCDMVEVSPPYDHLGATAHMAAHLMFEMLCVLPHNRT